MRARLVLILVVLIPIGYLGLQYHFIVLDDGFQYLKKAEPGLAYTFVDGRGAANKAKLLTNPTLLKAGIRNLLSGEGGTVKPRQKLKEAYRQLTEDD